MAGHALSNKAEIGWQLSGKHLGTAVQKRGDPPQLAKLERYSARLYPLQRKEIMDRDAYFIGNRFLSIKKQRSKGRGKESGRILLRLVVANYAGWCSSPFQLCPKTFPQSCGQHDTTERRYLPPPKVVSTYVLRLHAYKERLAGVGPRNGSSPHQVTLGSPTWAAGSSAQKSRALTAEPPCRFSIKTGQEVLPFSNTGHRLWAPVQWETARWPPIVPWDETHLTPTSWGEGRAKAAPPHPLRLSVFLVQETDGKRLGTSHQ